MLTLKLFGTPVVEAPAGQVTGRAAQGQRLALLSVLALARGRPVTRDKLVALLWPESTTDRARHQLSDTLYILRSGLGADVVRTAGDDLALDPAAATSDVERFERALDEGRLEDAVELLTAPLLDGFHLADAGEFERWLDGERARLGARHAAALETLAEDAERAGDPLTAVRWWRRLAALEPFGGRVALRLMRALEAAGDRTGALRHARVHAALLREELGAEPDAAVVELADRLRAESPPRRASRAAEASPSLVAAAGALTPTGGDDSAVQPRAAASPAPGEAAASRAASAKEPGRPPRRLRVGLAVAAALVAIVGAAAWGRGATGSRETPAAVSRSLAVLPFANMSADPADRYFSDGLTEQVITELSRIPGLRVVARSSSFALRDANLDVRVIGDTLGVDAVLEGSLRRDATRLRVTVQLIDAATGYQIWSGEFDRPPADVIAVQEEIAHRIAGALELRLPPHRVAVRPRDPPDPEAYELYLRALYLRTRLAEEPLRQAAELLDRAVDLDPGFARAHAARATVAGPRIFYRQIPQALGVREMRDAIARALELDPTIGEAHVALGMLRLFHDWDWDGAGRALREAVRRNPNDPHAWHHLASYHEVMGRFEDAADARARAAALDPLDARIHLVRAANLLARRRFDEALEATERARRLDPASPLLLGLGPTPPASASRVYLAMGREPEAVEDLLGVAVQRGATEEERAELRAAYARAGMRGFWRRWLDMDRRLSGPALDPLRAAYLHALAGEDSLALASLERAYAERNPGLIFLGMSRAFESLRANPGFARIVDGLRLPPAPAASSARPPTTGQPPRER